jgi:hypothetical protein
MAFSMVAEDVREIHQKHLLWIIKKSPILRPGVLAWPSDSGSFSSKKRLCLNISGVWQFLKSFS